MTDFEGLQGPEEQIVSRCLTSSDSVKATLGATDIDVMSIRFEAHPGVGEVFRLYSLDCVDLAREAFGETIEVTIDSLRQIETMAGTFHDQLPEADSSEQVERIAKILGGHIAHVIVQLHGWIPGKVFFDETQMFAIEEPTGNGLIWPPQKALKRLINGPEDNLWHYYQLSTDQLISWS